MTEGTEPFEREPATASSPDAATGPQRSPSASCRRPRSQPSATSR